MKRRISHGQATRSTLMFLRVIHFMDFSRIAIPTTANNAKHSEITGST